MTPGAEFNTYADSIASARIFALTSPNPRLTMPPTLPSPKKPQLPPYPASLSRPLTLKLFPLDITESHLLPKSLFEAYIGRESMTGSPLAQWTHLFLSATFSKNATLNPQHDPQTAGLQLHDPLPVWYALSAAHPAWRFQYEDVRVETSGQWTRGCCIVDRRGRGVTEGTAALDEEVVGDAGGWRDSRKGNRVGWCRESLGVEMFAGVLLERVFGGGEV